MNLKKSFDIPGVLVPSILAVLVYCFSVFSGTNGIYLFDTSINYNMGWLIYNGRIPYLDFSMPLTPLSGILTAIGYRIFGVNYMSGVFMGALISVFGLILIYYNLKKLLPWHINAAFSFFAVASTVPMFGVLYYNHLSMLFIMIISSYILRAICSDEDGYTPVNSLRFSAAYFFIGLLFLTKFHFGAILFLITLAFDVLNAFIKRPSASKALLSFVIRFLPAAITALATLVWLRFDLAQIIYDLFKLSVPRINLLSLFFDLGRPDSIFAQPQISLLMFIVFLPGLCFYLFRAPRKSGIPFQLFLFFVLMLIAQIFFTLISAEAPSINASLSMLLVICIYLIIENAGEKNTASQSSSQSMHIFIMPLLFTIGIFTLLYAGTSLRKEWIEYPGYFPSGYLENDRKFSTQMPYFNGIKMTGPQKDTIDFIYSGLKFYKKKKFFFGPELEILNAAAGTIPPKGWPLWIHENVSVRPESYGELASIFMKEKYDIVVLSKARRHNTRFLDPQLAANYTPVAIPSADIWLDVYLRKK